MNDFKCEDCGEIFDAENVKEKPTCPKCSSENIDSSIVFPEYRDRNRRNCLKFSKNHRGGDKI